MDIQLPEEPLTASAAWMLPAETAARYAFEAGDLWLGRNADEDRTPIGRNDDSHVLLCAKTRSGKGRALIANNLLLWPGSLFCNDPKGENASITAARRGNGSDHVKEWLGQKVCVLDSHGTADVDDEYRAHYNPLAELSADDLDTPTKASLIADSCVSKHQKMDTTWDDKARTFLKALILHIVSDRLIPDEHRNLVTLRRFIVAGDVFAVEYIKAKADPETLKASPPDGILLLLQSMQGNPAFDGIIADQAASYLESYRQQPRMWNSIRTSAEEHTDWIDDPRMRDVLRPGKYEETFRAEELQTIRRGLSVYVCLPSSMKDVFASWPRIIVNMILAAAQETGRRHPATGHQTLMMLDEFATMERMPKIETAAADIAGAGVKMFFVVQSLTQLKSVYGDAWETFASAADTHIYYGFNDNFTADYVSKRLGEAEIVRTMQSGSTALNESTATAEMRGGSSSTAHSTSTAHSQSTSRARGGGSSRNSGSSSGVTDTIGWGPSLFFRTLETTNQLARQNGRSYGEGRQKTFQKTKTKGTTRTRGTTETEGEQWSNTETRTQGRTDTTGWQQSLHRKPLAAINELMQLFGTIEDDDEDDLAYPGIGLISTASQRPMLLQKAYYDRDRFFEGLFDPHPKHGFKPLPAFIPPPKQTLCTYRTVVFDDFKDKVDTLRFKVQNKLHEGEKLKRGEVFAYYALYWHGLNPEYDLFTKLMTFRAPCRCRISHISRSDEGDSIVLERNDSRLSPLPDFITYACEETIERYRREYNIITYRLIAHPIYMAMPKPYTFGRMIRQILNPDSLRHDGRTWDEYLAWSEREGQAMVAHREQHEQRLADEMTALVND